MNCDAFRGMCNSGKHAPGHMLIDIMLFTCVQESVEEDVGRCRRLQENARVCTV